MAAVGGPLRADGLPPSGRSGLDLPAVSLGLWHNFGDDVPLERQREILRAAFDSGVTHVDLANNYGPPYGAAEANFGRHLATDFRGLRDELVISSKAGWDMWSGPYGDVGGSRKYLVASLDQSLRRMGLDYVDVFYHHRPDPRTPLAETMQALDFIVRSGRALYVGISSYSPELTREAAEAITHIRALDHLASSRGQTLAQMALAWALRDERVTSVLVGASSAEQIRDSVAAVDNLSFTDDELAEIDRHAVDSGIDLWAGARDSV